MATRKFRRKRGVLRKTQRKTNRKRIKRKNKTRKQKGGAASFPPRRGRMITTGLQDTKRKAGDFMRSIVKSVTPNRSRRPSATPNEIDFEVLSKTLPMPEQDHLEIGCPNGFTEKKIGYTVLKNSLNGLLKKMKENEKNYEYKMGLMAFDGAPLLEHDKFNNNKDAEYWIQSISNKLMEDVNLETLDYKKRHRKELGVIFFCIKIKKSNPYSILDEFFVKHLRVCEYDKVRGAATPSTAAEESNGGDKNDIKGNPASTKAGNVVGSGKESKQNKQIDPAPEGQAADNSKKGVVGKKSTRKTINL